MIEDITVSFVLGLLCGVQYNIAHAQLFAKILCLKGRDVSMVWRCCMTSISIRRSGILQVPRLGYLDWEIYNEVRWRGRG